MKKPFQKPFSAAIHELYRKALQHTKYRWLVIFGTLLYLASPLDISPDILPVLGWIDDGIVVSLLLTEVSQLIMQQVKSKRQIDKPFTAEPFITEPFDLSEETVPTITVKAVPVS